MVNMSAKFCNRRKSREESNEADTENCSNTCIISKGKITFYQFCADGNTNKSAAAFIMLIPMKCPDNTSITDMKFPTIAKMEQRVVNLAAPRKMKLPFGFLIMDARKWRNIDEDERPKATA
ncbi:hypothetical protein L484_023646 [Morus notabilis]|uniref:Uncharacterized protein n=1 Tax=Morus notabilis TaxID=981085 RepID=W9RS27_9ROSA|nr:hypothetical protein L484_023646 [Morus notabilis]